MSGLQAACEAWRGREDQAAAAIVLQDSDLQRVIAVWPFAPVEARRPCPPDAGWADLWASVAVDERALCELTGLSTGRALVAWRRACGLRLIYPDGTVHHVARMVLKKLLHDAMGGSGKR